MLALVNEEEKSKGRLKYLIHTKVGDGPRVVSDLEEQNDHLLHLSTGLPLSLTNNEEKSSQNP